jgi:hypothetical protein
LHIEQRFDLMVQNTNRLMVGNLIKEVDDFANYYQIFLIIDLMFEY